MSAQRHPDVSQWQRDERGGYRREVNGWELRVTWRPPSPEHRRGFSWVASRPGETTLRAPEVHEEIELAMAEAEDAAEREPTDAG